MKKKIIELVNEMVSNDNMMEYTEFELEDLINDIANKLNKKAILWVTEISDGKYLMHINKNNIEKTIEINAWDNKKYFADAVNELFSMPN